MTATLAPLEVDASNGVAQVDLAGPLPTLVAIPALGARCLVRRAGRPVAMVDVDGSAPVLAAEELQAHIAAQGITPASAPPQAAIDSARAELTVVIATRDRPELLARCLRSVLACDPPPAAVIVVDNAPSDDRSRQLIDRDFSGDRSVRYVREDRPGLGRAHNAALPHLTTSHVAFTDDDVVVDPRWLGCLAEAFAVTNDVACVTGLIAPAELRTPQQWWVERGVGFAKGFDRRVRSLRDTTGEGALFPYDAGSLGSGANMAFRTDALRQIGGFDPALGTGTRSLGGDDLQALHHVIAVGHDLVYEPAAIVFHPHHATTEALKRQARGYGAGLGAYLTSVVIHHPGAIVDVIKRLPSGLRHLTAPSSALNDRRPPDYPRSLVWRERLAVFSGPVRYGAQRLADRRSRSNR